MIPKNIIDQIHKQAERYSQQALELRRIAHRYSQREEKECMSDAIDLVSEVICSNDNFSPQNHILLSRLASALEDHYDSERPQAT